MIKQLAKCFGKYKWHAIITPFLVMIEVILEVLIPMLMANMIDIGIEKRDIGYIVRTGLLMVGMAVLSLLIGSTSGRLSAIASTGFAKNVRHKMFNNIQNYAFSNIDKFSTASLITRLTTDVTITQDALQMSLRTIIRAPVMLLTSTTMAIILNYRLAIIFLCAVPFLGIMVYFIISKAHPHFIALFKKYDKMNLVVQENLIGIRTVKSYVRESFEIEKYKESSKNLQTFSKKAEKIVIFNMPAMQFTIYACILSILWFGGNMIVFGDMTAGKLTSFLSYVMLVLNSLMMFSIVFINLIMSKAAAIRIVEILNENSDIKQTDNPIKTVKDGSIEFRNVNFGYNKNDKYILKDINYSIKHGETVGLIGGTGSAKSTLVQLIPRLYDVLQGKIFVGGIDVKDYDLTALRDSVAIVLQKNVLFSGTIEENLRWGNKTADMNQIIESAKMAQAHDFIMSFPDGYNTYLEQGGVNLSGGQKQRLCIARALLKNPKILILDDSTSAVDTKTDLLIRQAFGNELKDITKIIIAQRIASIENSDKIIVIDEGKIKGIGSHNQMMAENEIYREVYTSQKGIGVQND